MHGAIVRWIEDAIPPGNFLTAVLSNDLCEACGRADDTNQTLLFAYISWLYSQAPGGCWGSPERFQAWRGTHFNFAEARAS
jgi:hypothetical protein